MLKLYYAQKTVAFVPHIMLEEVKADYEAIVIDFSTQQQQSDDYKKINPAMRVPSLDTEYGILTEAPAIIHYIHCVFADKGLLPQDAFAMAKAQQLISYMASTVHINHAHRFRGYRWSDDSNAHKSMQEKVPETMTQSLKLLENNFFKGPYVLGDKFTALDPYVLLGTIWAIMDGADQSQFPKLCDHHRMIQQRSSVAKIMELYGFPSL